MGAQRGGGQGWEGPGAALRVGAQRGGGPNPEKWGPKRWGPRRGGAPRGGSPKGWGPEGVGARTRKKWGPEGVGGPMGGGPKISRFFFPSPAGNFFFFSLGVFSWNFGGVFEAPEDSNVHVWALGLSCASPVWWGRRGFTREPKRAHLRVPVFKNTKIQREDLPEREEKIVFCGGREKKERNFGRSRGRAAWRRGVRGGGPKILNTSNRHHQQAPPTGTSNRHQQQAPATGTSNRHQQQAPATGTNRHQQAPTAQHQQAPTGTRHQQTTTSNNQEHQQHKQ